MDLSMRDTIEGEKSMDKGFTFGVMDLDIQEIGLIIELLDM